jgi:hypothetical protein
MTFSSRLDCDHCRKGVVTHPPKLLPKPEGWIRVTVQNIKDDDMYNPMDKSILHLCDQCAKLFSEFMSDYDA